MTRRAGAVSSRGKCGPVAGCGPPCILWYGLASPARCPIALWRGPLGHAPGSDGVGLFGIVVPATTFVARLSYDYPGFNSNALSEDLFSDSLYPATHGAPNDFGMRVFAQIVSRPGGIRNRGYGKSPSPPSRRLVQGFKGFLDDWRAL